MERQGKRVSSPWFLMKDKIALIIPVRNLSWMTINLLESIKSTTDLNEIFFVIVDNGSTQEESDKVHTWVDTNTKLYEIIWFKEPLGFIGAVNSGLQYVFDNGFKFFFIFNNDTLVTSEWLPRMLESLKKDMVAIVGGMTSPPDWRKLPESEDIIRQKKKYKELKKGLEGFSKILRQNLNNVEKEVDFMPFYGTGFKASAAREIGYLEKRFFLGLFDDDDYCLRTLKMGYKIVHRKDVYIHHYHNSTFIEHGINYDQLLETNRQVFIDKWGFDPWKRRENLKKV